MNNRNRTKTIMFIVILIAVLTVGSIWIFNNYKEIDRLKTENSRLKTGISYLEGRLIEYQDALEEANTIIEDAQSQAWSSYQEMGEILENLDTVQEP